MGVAYVSGKIIIKLLQQTVSIPHPNESQHVSSMVWSMLTLTATNIHTRHPSLFIPPGPEMLRDAPVHHQTGEAEGCKTILVAFSHCGSRMRLLENSLALLMQTGLFEMLQS